MYVYYQLLRQSIVSKRPHSEFRSLRTMTYIQRNELSHLSNMNHVVWRLPPKFRSRYRLPKVVHEFSLVHALLAVRYITRLAGELNHTQEIVILLNSQFVLIWNCSTMLESGCKQSDKYLFNILPSQANVLNVF